MIYLSEVLNPNKKKLIADFFLVGHLHLVDIVIHRKASTQFTCAHCQRSITCITFC